MPAVAAVGHIVLLGDSIFDNRAYVPQEPAVVDQLKAALPAGWYATLLAVDGSATAEVRDQLVRIPDDATHLFVSAGGNDALNESGVLKNNVRTVSEGAGLLAAVQARFQSDYKQMLRAVLSVRKPVAVCTIYDSIPGLGAPERAAVSLFNDVILRSAFAIGLPVIDLRLVCDKPDDYSAVSPIEPSARGGAKIAAIVAEVALLDKYPSGHTVVYR
jgi:hypothetical protein